MVIDFSTGNFKITSITNDSKSPNWFLISIQVGSSICCWNQNLRSAKYLKRKCGRKVSNLQCIWCNFLPLFSAFIHFLCVTLTAMQQCITGDSIDFHLNDISFNITSDAFNASKLCVSACNVQRVAFVFLSWSFFALCSISSNKHQRLIDVWSSCLYHFHIKYAQREKERDDIHTLTRLPRSHTVTIFLIT